MQLRVPYLIQQNIEKIESFFFLSFLLIEISVLIKEAEGTSCDNKIFFYYILSFSDSRYLIHNKFIDNSKVTKSFSKRALSTFRFFFPLNNLTLFDISRIVYRDYRDFYYSFHSKQAHILNKRKHSNH